MDEAEFSPEPGLLHETSCHSVAFVVIVQTDHLEDQMTKKVLNIVVVFQRGLEDHMEIQIFTIHKEHSEVVTSFYYFMISSLGVDEI